MGINTLIIDDEPLAIEVIKGYIAQQTELVVLATFSNAIDALNFLKTNAVDIIFLDINMPLLSGIDFIKSLEQPPLIVITTAYHEFAIETYELDVVDYLLKPIQFSRFLKTINKINKRLEKKQHSSSKENPYIFIKLNKKKIKKIFLDDIFVVESLKDYLKIITSNGSYIVHYTLTEFTKLLAPQDFIRIHRSYTIAISKIDNIDGNSVEIEGIRYIIGRSYIDEVKQKILKS